MLCGKAVRDGLQHIKGNWLEGDRLLGAEYCEMRSSSWWGLTKMWHIHHILRAYDILPKRSIVEVKECKIICTPVSNPFQYNFLH
jgi:hypothetical protein